MKFIFISDLYLSHNSCMSAKYSCVHKRTPVLHLSLDSAGSEWHTKKNIKNITHRTYRAINGYTKFPLYLSLYRTAEGSFRLVFRQYIKALPTLKIPSYQTGFADAASAHDYGEPCR